MSGSRVKIQRGPFTVCSKGHFFDERNTYTTPDGSEECLACRRETGRKAAKKARTAGPYLPRELTETRP